MSPINVTDRCLQPRRPQIEERGSQFPHQPWYAVATMCKGARIFVPSSSCAQEIVQPGAEAV